MWCMIRLVAINTAVLGLASVIAGESLALALTQDKADDAIAAVENGLYPKVRVEGQKPWTIAERMKHYNVPGLSMAVVYDHKIAWAKGYGVIEANSKPVTLRTAFQAASISKSINGFGIVRLADQGKLDLDADINKYLKTWEFPYDQKFGDEKITIKNLLSHTAGLTVHGFGGYQSADGLPSVSEILDGKSPANSGPVRSFRSPNKGYKYSGGGTVISQRILEDTLEVPYEQFVKDYVLDPIGMKDSFYRVNASNESRVAVAHRSNGARLPNGFNYYPEQAPAGLWTTPSDLARFIISTQAVLAGKSDSVMSKSAAEMMLRPHLAGTPSALGFFVEDRNGAKYFQHGGSNEGFKAQYFGSFEGGNGVAVMVNSDSFNIIPEIIQSVATVYKWPNFYDAKVRKPVEVTETDLKPLAGVYQIPGGPRLRIIAEGNQLFLGTSFGNRFELFPESKTSFFLKVEDEQVHFKSENGVESLDFVQNGRSTKAVKRKASLAFAMLDRINQSDVNKGLKWFRANEADETFEIDVFDLNEVGYTLFQSSRVTDAIKVFRFAIENYPSHETRAINCWKKM